MTNANSPESYMNLTAVDPEGDKIGSVGQVYVNDESGVPDWITVNTGLFGMRENFVPLQGARVEGERLVLPFGKDVVKDAPDIADASHLDVNESDALYAYYQQYMTGGRVDTVTTGRVSDDTTTDYTPTGRDISHESYGSDTDVKPAGYDTSGPNTDEAMTRSEEHLNVGTEKVEAGRARLRKYVVTEQQTVTVPVSHEEVRIEREPITEANRGDAYAGAEISEEEHEVVLHAERPVVTTEAVAVERVRLGTETVTENQSVSGEVRKEQIELDNSAGEGPVAGAVDPADKR